MTALSLKLAAGLLPVLAFLLFLIYLDSYKLVRLRTVVVTILGGAATAGVAFYLNRWVIDLTGIELVHFARYVAPPVEESLKGVALIWLLRTHRIGFLVDAAIFGFALGAGFALLENLYYVYALTEAGPAVWILRGFGTALMHGGTTAILAIVAKSLSDRRGSSDLPALVPGWLVAVVVHAFFNHFFFSPALSALLVIVLLPPLLYVVFGRSEAAMRDWIGHGFDQDAALLELLHSGEFRDSKPGRYLSSLKSRFPGEVMVDMLCFLRLYLELAIRAKGELMMRESGFRSPIEPEIRDKLTELRFLEKSIGRTGRLALQPVMPMAGREAWQLFVIDE